MKQNERLTDECWRNFDPWECCGQDKFCKRGCHEEGGCTNGCIVPKLYRRLAQYEDIGLSPEEVRKIMVNEITKNIKDNPVSNEIKDDKNYLGSTVTFNGEAPTILLEDAK